MSMSVSVSVRYTAAFIGKGREKERVQGGRWGHLMRWAGEERKGENE